ncbi:MAG: MFS transporter [Clostridiales Family XIII bacterium]|nr:MFS transporter [Clostridiales Family XIII bacterium]
MKREKIYYGWLLCIASLLMLAGGTGIFINTASQFMKPMVEALGITRWQFSLYQSIISIPIMLLCPLLGKVYSKIKPRVIAVIGGSCAVVCWVMTSFVQDIVQLLSLGFVLGVGLTFIGMASINILINNWFSARKGTAMGIAMTGSGVGSMIFNPVASLLITQFGYQAAFRYLGIFSILCMLPFFILFRFKPEEKGLAPLGIEQVKGDDKPIELPGIPFSEARRSPYFWGICAIAFILSASSMGMFTQEMPYLTDIGFPALKAAGLISATSLSLAIGKVLFGWANDRFGTKINFFVLTICSTLGLVFLYFASAPYCAYISAVLFGFALASPFVLAPLITVYKFGEGDFVNIYGSVTFFTFLGSTLAPPLSGWIYDIQGSYHAAFYLYTGLLVVAIAVGYFVLRRGEFSSEQPGVREQALDRA